MNGATGATRYTDEDLFDDEQALDDAYDADHGITGDHLFDGPPIPLTVTEPVPPFPTDALPAPIRDMVEATATATQTDPAMAGSVALSVLSACTGGHAQIQIRPGWHEPLCIYSVTVADPGERKSSVQAGLVAPLLKVEARLAGAAQDARLEAETLKKIAVADAEKAQRAATSATGAEKLEKQADAVAAAQQAEAIKVPVIPRLVADDVTPEAAAGVLAEQGGRLAIISAEGGIFDTIGGRYSQGVPNLDIWLKGHAGEPVRVDRRGRAPEYVDAATITLGLMVQHSVVAGLARSDAFRGRGLLARILWALPESKLGRRRIAPPPVPEDVRGRYETEIEDLAEGLAGWLGDPALLILSPEAEEQVQALEADIEPQLGPDGALSALTGWGSKYVGAVVRIAGLLHFAEHGPDGARRPVEVSSVDAAIKAGSYFRATAINVFGRFDDDEMVTDAKYLLDRILRIGSEEVSVRQMQRAAKRFKTRDQIEPVIELLVEYDFLALSQGPTSTGGRPSSPRYRINPRVTETQGTQGTQALGGLSSVPSVPTVTVPPSGGAA